MAKGGNNAAAWHHLYSVMRLAAVRLASPIAHAAEVHAPDMQAGLKGPPAPAGVRYLPGEDVLLLTVSMPDMPMAQRRGAVGFAVEDHISEPLEEVYVVLGPRMPTPADGGQNWLVAVISRAALDARSSRETPHDQRRLLPDTLALPRPDQGFLSVWEAAGRVLVRCADGTGFATTTEALPMFWAAAGSPDIVLFGGALPGGFGIATQGLWPGALDASLADFDLRNASRASRKMQLPKGIKPILTTVCIAALGHLGLILTDTLALSQIASARAASLQSALSAAGQPDGIALDAAVQQILGQRQDQTAVGFLALLTQIFAAITPLSNQLSLRDLQFSAPQGTIALTLEASDLALLQQAETSLRAAGLTVVAGAATTSNGLAEVLMTLQGTTQ